MAADDEADDGWLATPSMPSAPTGNWSIQCAKLLGNTLKNEKLTILQAHAGLASVSQALLALKVLSVYYTTILFFVFLLRLFV